MDKITADDIFIILIIILILFTIYLYGFTSFSNCYFIEGKSGGHCFIKAF